MTEMHPFKIMPAAVFDFDGTIRHVKNGLTFANKPEDYELFPGVEEKLHEVKQSGYLIFGVTNQGGVAYGHRTVQQLAEEISYTIGLFSENPFNIVKACMFMPGGTVAPYNKRSLMRKPDIGMLVMCEYEAMRAGFVVDWDNSFMVGDRDEDRLCAQRANIKFHWAHDFFGRVKAAPKEVEDKFQTANDKTVWNVEFKPRIILPNMKIDAPAMRIENIELPKDIEPENGGYIQPETSNPVAKSEFFAQHETVINKDGTFGISPLNFTQLGKDTKITDKKDEDDE